MASPRRCSVSGCPDPYECSGLCNRHRMRLARSGTTDAPADAETRFWRLCDPDGPVAALVPHLGSCWRWTGSHDPDGYPTFRGRSAAVFAWSLASGAPAPAGLRLVRFACGWRGCVNPDHLRPRWGLDSVDGRRGLAAWNMRHDACPEGHAFTRANSITVPGGRVCRQCRADVARARRTPGAVPGVSVASTCKQVEG